MSSRRTFLKLASTMALGSVLPRATWSLDPHAPAALHKFGARLQASPEWPSGPDVHLGRGALGWGAPILSRPHPDGTLLGHVFPDEVVKVNRHVVGLGMAYHTHVWYELDEGYVYFPSLQPVQNVPQTPLTSVPSEGLWTEISVPFVDAYARPDAAAPLVYRLYYSSVFKILETVTGADGQPWYSVGMETQITMFAPAAAFRVIQPEELTAISPEVDPAEKTMVVYLAEQAVSAFDGKREVYRLRISSGANYFGEDGVTLLNGTPQGAHNIWSKRISRHMQGGTIDAGYDVPGVGWVGYFSGNGAALHSTYWHNDYGIPKSHGCLNCRPEDAKWLFRWSAPHVPYNPGDITVNWENRGTIVDLRDAHT